VHALLEMLGDSPLEILLEPGRAIAGNAGILLTRVEYLKHTAERHFAIVDAAMNDLQRPALYDAWHDIVPVQPRTDAPVLCYDVVGPVCETGDFLGKQRQLALASGDMLVVRSAGAYGFSMSSNYNSRPRAAEVMVDGERLHIVRARETLEDLCRGEHLLPE
jgi:diaminopimelate decarboxylase